MPGTNLEILFAGRDNGQNAGDSIAPSFAGMHDYRFI
jgi:hypothetical protein